MTTGWRPPPPTILRRRLYHGNLIQEAQPPDPSPYPDHLARLLDQLRSPNSIATLKKIHSLLVTTHPSDAGPSTQTKLLRAYFSSGDPSTARKLFDGMPQRDTLSWNAMIRGYVNSGLHRDAILVFCRMISEGVQPDAYTLPCTLKACLGTGSLLSGMQIHSCAVRRGLDKNVFVGNALISTYARCGITSAARSVFDGMDCRDVVSWNAIISSYAQQGEVSLAVEMCREMVELSDLTPDDCTMASISLALLDAGPSSLMFIRRIFDKMPNKGLISWNSMIKMCVRNGMAAEAIELFCKMELVGIEPDEVTLASILPACGDLSALALGERIHRHMKWKGIEGNLLLENALINMYAKCGCLERAKEVFDAMRRRDVVSWTSMILAYGMSGLGRKAVDLFEQMQGSGLRPDKIAFVSILSACSHSGLVEEGRYYFKCMTAFYHMVPALEHFACMVDLLGRSGNIAEAYAFVKAMPVVPNEGVWGALLSACWVYSNMTIGLIAADQLLKLAPERSGYLVILSNIYAKAGRWEDVASLRNKMKSKGLKKLPGLAT